MDFTSLIWNARGIGNPPTQRHLDYLCHSHNIKIVAVLEPMTAPNPYFFGRRLGFSQVLSNQSNKIWCFGHHHMHIEVLIDKDQLLHVKVSSPLFPRSVLMTFIYAKCDRAERRFLWDDLRDIASSAEGHPWLVGGDFNTILHSYERLGSNTNRFMEMFDFGEMISDCELQDAGCEGEIFTWERQGLKERLDRVLYSEEWASTFFSTKVVHLPRIWSDHAPLLATTTLSHRQQPSSFRFQHMWVRHFGFLDVVRQAWDAPTGETGMKNLQIKLVRVKQRL